MAYEEDLEGDEGGLGAPSQGGAQGSGGGIITGGQQAAPSDQMTPTESGQFTNLKSYLDANVDQTGALADRVSNEISGKIDDVQTGATGTRDTFQSQVQSQLPNYNRNYLQNYQQGNIVGQSRTPTVSSVSAAAGTGYRPEMVQYQSNIQDFTGGLGDETRQMLQRTRDAQYQGPENLNELGFQQFLTQAESARRTADLTQSEEGRFDLLRQTVNDPGYTRGMTRLDQGLLSMAPNARGRFAEIRQQAMGLDPFLQSLQESVQGLPEQARAQIEADRGMLRDDLGNIIGTERSQFGSAASQMNNELREAGDMLRGIVGSSEIYSQLTPTQRAQMNNAIFGQTLGGNRPSWNYQFDADDYTLFAPIDAQGRRGRPFDINTVLPVGAQRFSPASYGLDLGEYVTSGPSLNMDNTAALADRQALADLAGLGGLDVNWNTDTANEFGAVRRSTPFGVGYYENNLPSVMFQRGNLENDVLGVAQNIRSMRDEGAGINSIAEFMQREGISFPTAGAFPEQVAGWRYVNPNNSVTTIDNVGADYFANDFLDAALSSGFLSDQYIRSLFDSPVQSSPPQTQTPIGGSDFMRFFA